MDGQRPALTSGQRRALAVLVASTLRNGFPPSVRELAGELGVAQSSAAHYLRVLRDKGYIEHIEGRARAIRIVE